LQCRLLTPKADIVKPFQKDRLRGYNFSGQVRRGGCENLSARTGALAASSKQYHFFLIGEVPMSSLYGPIHRTLQERFDTRRLADNVEKRVVLTEIPPEHKTFIESRDMFFLSTIDHQGRPTVSYKGGDPGFVRVVDNKTIAFPCYDGNGMFYSMGNLMGNGQVGMLFIDFERPHRLRLQGIANVDDGDPLLQNYAEAQLVVRVTVSQIFRNCPRYVHRYTKTKLSEYVPRSTCETPLAPWKRVDDMQASLPAKDRARVKQQGGVISRAEYEKYLAHLKDRE
jgi:predicted pyridoxine 5'-phosphate oxidase superfamily flavin-nucleotide-binding protein